LFVPVAAGVAMLELPVSVEPVQATGEFLVRRLLPHRLVAAAAAALLPATDSKV